MTDTIFALSSGPLPSGVALVRVSGPRVRFVLETTVGAVPKPRHAALKTLGDFKGEPLDRALVLFFPGPASFTGEDVAEFHLHGGRAVVAGFLAFLTSFDGLRLAEAGEFTRRAFENGQLDLTEAEGLADLIAAETEAQRKMALRQAGGAFRAKAEDWRHRLIDLRALVEAGLDFSDEDDVPEDVSAAVIGGVETLRSELDRELEAGSRGERIRDGFEVVVLGPPNAGKSSLVNILAERDVAIVTDIPGTTRDLLEVHLNLDGYAVTLVDTAGLRQGTDAIEVEGIRRGKERAATADLILWLDEKGRTAPADVLELGRPILNVTTKVDLSNNISDGATISVRDRTSIDRLIALLSQEAATRLRGEAPLVSRARQRDCVNQAVEALKRAEIRGLPSEIVADYLREAGEALGRLTGRIDVEEVLGSIFSTFCIGK